MENNIMEFTLPPAPRGLCFDRNDFVKTNFSVDNFLAEHQNVASLETMRDDLGVYLKVLRLAMIELINKDYANFVNLCATLIGFDKAIVKIQVPLGQLNDEVISVKQCLEDAMKELSLWMSQRHGLQKKKQLLKHYSQTINCLKTLDSILKNITLKKRQEQVALADRAAMQYNQLKFSIAKCDSIIKPEHKLQYNEVGGKLIQTLNELLFNFWNNSEEENLLKTLITLASLARVNESEMLIRKQAVAPLLQDIINEPALQKSKEGLQGIYDRILSLLDTKLKLLLTVTQHSKLSFLVKKYRFLVNCFWCEVENRLEVNLASIFAPGNPQIFYRRYSESVEFIKKLEKYCSADDMKLLRETSEYKSFQRRWNLPVYFQIRFQEIAGSYEAALQKSPTLEPNEEFVLRETQKCWNAIQECWSDGVYIEALAHKFWKLTLQLLSRYATWANAYCTQLRVHVKVLKKGVLDEQAKSNELRETLKDKEKSLRKGELEIDSLTFRNQQLTRRVSVLQDELDALQLKLTKKSKNKGDDKQQATVSSAAALDSGLLQEELQKKIIENAQYASQLSDKVFEVSQLRASLEDYQRLISESDSKYKCEIAKLKNKNQELQYSLEEAQRERIGGTPNKIHLATSSQTASCNGDFLSEGGSLVGSEDALSSVEDMNVTEQLSIKAHSLEQENQKLKMEFEMLRMENESLKLEVAKYVSASQKRRGDGHDSGDFNTFGETSVDAEGRVTGLLGSLQVPFLLTQEIETREERMKTYFRNKISELKIEREELKSKTEHYVKECEMLRLRFEEMEREKQSNEHTLSEKHNTISRLEEELHSTSHNYEEQMSVLTEHVAGLNEQLTKQHDEIQLLKHALNTRKK